MADDEEEDINDQRVLSLLPTKFYEGYDNIMNVRFTIRCLLSLLVSRLAMATGKHKHAFTLGIRDSFMIAHSFHGHPSFGPAGGLHGATYTCDVEFCTDHLVEDLNWVIDIGKASEILAEVLAIYNYQNLDQVFPDQQMTTTEFMCRQVFGEICRRLQKEEIDFRGEICVKLWESHKAWASYTGSVES
jgi:6-pyruvoyltetrahydropterin/6-carboxytetrahydropterin synthase